MLNWANQFGTFCFLDNQQYNIPPHNAECILAAGVHASFSFAKNNFTSFQKFIDEEKRWLFGHLCYDLKNELHASHSSLKKDNIGFNDLFFFEPQVLIRFNEKEISITSSVQPAEKIYTDILAAENKNASPHTIAAIQQRLSKQEYISIIKQLQKHILRGDCYEINFCQEFFATGAVIDPIDVYKKLIELSPNPFSALYKLEDKYLLCASPERFLFKKNNQLISQPIKGTAKRGTTKKEDVAIKKHLQNSNKERSENVMVVDLVRNDISQVCKEGTVKVDELYGIYTFPQVHQMISTISGELKDEISFTEIIKATFPMGSMTGAPKKRVMELIDKYEPSKRGIFSGAVGYLTPDGDFDLNVVIRSIMYNSSSNYLSFQTGSGITFYADAEQEWEECLLKAKAIQQILQ